MAGDLEPTPTTIIVFTAPKLAILKVIPIKKVAALIERKGLNMAIRDSAEISIQSFPTN